MSSSLLDFVLSLTLIVGSLGSWLGLLWIFDKTYFVLMCVIVCCVVRVRFTDIKNWVYPVRAREAQRRVEERRQQRRAQMLNALNMEKRQVRSRRDKILLRLEDVQEKVLTRTRASAHHGPGPAAHPPRLTTREEQREARRLRAVKRQYKKEEHELLNALIALEQEEREIRAQELELHREAEALRDELL